MGSCPSASVPAMYLTFLITLSIVSLSISRQRFTYSFNDQNIDELNVTEVAQQWRENRNVVREIYNSSLEGVLHAISKVQTKGDSMMTGIRKQRHLLMAINDEIEEGIEDLKLLSEQLESEEKSQRKCQKL